MSDRKFVALVVAVTGVPCVVAGLALGTLAAVAYDRLRSLATRPWWVDPDV